MGLTQFSEHNKDAITKYKSSIAFNNILTAVGFIYKKESVR